MNWKIDKKQLINYQKPKFYNNMEDFTVTCDGKYGVLLYNIYECSMCACYCVFAIYSNSDFKNPLVYLNTDKRPIFYSMKNTYDYVPLSDCLVMVYSIYNKNSTIPSRPYIFIKPSEKRFALVPWDFTSIYYGFNEISEDILELYEKFPKELDYYEKQDKHKRKTGMIINLKELKWYDTKEIGKVNEIYHNGEY